VSSAASERALVRLAGGLLVGGLLVFLVVTMSLHPSGDENDHPVIFAKYADSEAWVAAHFGQFVGVLVALGGFLILWRALSVRAQVPTLARCAAGATVATAAVWAVLQAVDGVALKQAVDAWADASGAEKAARFGDAETVRWTEWGLQSYFRLLLGLTFVLFGLAIARTGLVARWLGWIGALGGILYMTVGIAVGYSGFEKPGGPVIQLLFFIFALGILVDGSRRKTDLVEAPG
jgi:Domain of unknown function (DUF4386)